MMDTLQYLDLSNWLSSKDSPIADELGEVLCDEGIYGDRPDIVEMWLMKAEDLLKIENSDTEHSTAWKELRDMLSSLSPDTLVSVGGL